MYKSFIAIIGQKKIIENNTTHFGASYQYLSAIKEAKGFPFIISDMLNQKEAREIANLSAGLLLTGGQDISPDEYGESNSDELSRNIDKNRDLAELLLIREFIELRKPILGICRGMQILNVFFGGSLYQDIPSQLNFDYAYDTTHEVTIERNNILHELFGDKTKVNSLHHQAVKKLGENLTIIARDSNHNEIIEAYKHNSLPILGVQWHPEMLSGTNKQEGIEDMITLFEWFLEECNAVER